MRKSTPAGEPSGADVDPATLQMPSLPANYVSPEVVAKHRRNLARLEEELKAERNLRREADGEVIKLRAQINGVELNEAEVDALLAQKLRRRPKRLKFAHPWKRKKKKQRVSQLRLQTVLHRPLVKTSPSFQSIHFFPRSREDSLKKRRMMRLLSDGSLIFEAAKNKRRHCVMVCTGLSLN